MIAARSHQIVHRKDGRRQLVKGEQLARSGEAGLILPVAIADIPLQNRETGLLHRHLIAAHALGGRVRVRMPGDDRNAFMALSDQMARQLCRTVKV